MELTTKVEGLQELAKACRELPLAVGRSALRQAAAAGMAEVRNAVRAKAPVYTGPVSLGHPPPGTLRRSVAMRRDNRSSGPQKQTYQVFVRSGGMKGVKANGRTDGYYGHMVEFGTVKMSARPFMRPGFDGARNQAVTKLSEILKARIELEAQKLNRR